MSDTGGRSRASVTLHTVEATYELLDSLLNNLDDLYDGKSSPENTQAVIAAAASELAGTRWEPVLTHTADDLAPVIGAEDAQELALVVTDDLRLLLAEESARLEGDLISANRTRMNEAQLVGLSVDAARERVEAVGLQFRISGQPEPYFTWDPRRVTMDVTDGLVRHADIG
jgi:hypothetical protein